MQSYNQATLITLAALQLAHTLEIVEFVVPSVVEVGSENVVLDCNYNFDEAEASELEVKWYFNEDPAPFLVWIAGRRDSRPQLIGSMFEGKIDLEYRATEEPHTRHRARTQLTKHISGKAATTRAWALNAPGWHQRAHFCVAR